MTGVVAMMLGLGVGIDYALFILTRHRQNLASGQAVPVAIGRANATAGLSVLFAGVTVMVAILGLKVSGVPMMEKMGYGSAIMVAVVMLASITLLPAILGLVKHRVNSARIPFVKPKESYDPDPHRLGGQRASSPGRVLYGGVAAAVLAVFAIPAFSMYLGFADAGNDAPSSTTRKAYDLVADGYGPGVNGPLEVVLDTDGSRIPAGTIDEVSTALAEPRRAWRRSTPRRRTQAGDIAVIGVIPTTSPQDERTSALLERLREDTIPTALDGSEVSGVRHGLDRPHRRRVVAPAPADAVVPRCRGWAVVPGADGRVPLGAGAVEGRCPEHAQHRAAYGVVVAVFQWGWGAGAIGVHETVPIMPLAPMLMFAILFGLSMDYEVFR